MAGQKERGGTSRFLQARREEMAGGGELRYLEREKETEQTQSCRGDLPKCRWKRESGPQKGSPKASWAARPMGFKEGNQATKLREDLEVLSQE